MTQHKPGGIVSLTTQTQQVRVQTLCHIQLTAEQVKE